MFVVSLTYKVALAEIDKLRDAHMDWLRAGYADGVFIASGAKRPRTGGVILARGTREALDARLAEDPFARAGAADYDIIDFAATSVASGLEALKDT